MRKIPTLFRRDPDNPKRVLDEVTPGCEWVIQGEGVATRKYDGTCVMFDGQNWYARREVKAGKQFPDNFETINFDAYTGKTVGWIPMPDSPWLWWHCDALANATDYHFDPGTYELCGPKVNGNPEGFDYHVLVPHHDAELVANVPRTYEGLSTYLKSVPYEGVVWHHLDGRMAKLKKRDFA